MITASWELRVLRYLKQYAPNMVKIHFIFVVSFLIKLNLNLINTQSSPMRSFTFITNDNDR